MAEPFEAPPAPSWVTRSMNAVPLADGALTLAAPERGQAPLRCRVIGLVPGQLLTEALEEEASVRDGQVVADPARDHAKIAVVERHHATGRVGVGLVKGFGLQAGAFASTVAHDAHNVVVVGTDDADMAACVARLGELGGGVCVVRDGTVLAELPLPVAGLMSELPGEQVAAQLDAVQAQLRGLGVGLPEPVMALSFLALSVIPELKLTDRGLVDVGRGTVVPLEV